MPGIGLSGWALSLPGRPPDRRGVAVLRAGLQAGARWIDTSDGLALREEEGPHNLRLVAEATRGHDARILLRVGMRRPGGVWIFDTAPDALRRAVDTALEVLDRARIDCLVLHGPPPDGPVEPPLEVLADLVEQGLAGALGLANAPIEILERARAVAPLAVVPWRYSWLARRADHAGVLAWCRAHDARFAAHEPAAPGPALETDSQLIAWGARHQVTPGQAAVAWVANRHPDALVLPCPRSEREARAFVAAGNVQLQLERER